MMSYTLLYLDRVRTLAFNGAFGIHQKNRNFELNSKYGNKGQCLE